MRLLLGILALLGAHLSLAEIARAEEGFAFGKSIPRADQGVLVGLGPALQFGGYIPNVLHAGGSLTLLVRGEFIHGMEVALFANFAYLRALTPASLYGLAIKGSRPNVNAGWCLGWHPLAFCVGLGLGGGAFFNHEPNGDWMWETMSRTTFELGVNGMVQVAKRVSLRVYPALKLIPLDTNLRVDDRADQTWEPFPVFGMLTVEVMFTLYKAELISRQPVGEEE